MSPQPTYRFILFVAGSEPNSRTARENLARLCDDLGEGCRMQVVDVLEDMTAAIEHHVLLTPSLLVLAPKPEGLIVGNLSNRHRVERVLGIDSARKIP